MVFLLQVVGLMILVSVRPTQGQLIEDLDSNDITEKPEKDSKNGCVYDFVIETPGFRK